MCWAGGYVMYMLADGRGQVLPPGVSACCWSCSGEHFAMTGEQLTEQLIKKQLLTLVPDRCLS